MAGELPRGGVRFGGEIIVGCSFPLTPSGLFLFDPAPVVSGSNRNVQARRPSCALLDGLT